MDVKELTWRDISFKLRKAIGAPTLFLDFLPIELLSIVIGPYVEIEGARGVKRPNLSLLFLSPPGIGKKTYLIEIIKRISREFNHIGIVSPGSPEGLIDYIEREKKDSYLIVKDELGRMMRRERTGKHYTSGTMEAIIKLTDGVEERIVFSQRGEVKEDRVIPGGQYVCFIGASQDFFFEKEDLYGGFLRRLIILSVQKNDNPKGYLLEEGDIDPEEVIREIVEWLKGILRWIWERGGRVKVRFSPEARSEINKIATAIEKGEERPYIISLPEFLVKISALIAVSKRRDEVLKEDVEEAKELLKKASKGIMEIQRRLRGEANTLERMLRHVKKQPAGVPIGVRDLCRSLHLTKDEVVEALDQLEGIRSWREGTKRYIMYEPGNSQE